LESLAIGFLANLTVSEERHFYETLKNSGAVESIAWYIKHSVHDDVLFQAGKFLTNMGVHKEMEPIIMRAIGSFGSAMALGAHANKDVQFVGKRLMCLFPQGKQAQKGNASLNMINADDQAIFQRRFYQLKKHKEKHGVKEMKMTSMDYKGDPVRSRYDLEAQITQRMRRAALNAQQSEGVAGVQQALSLRQQAQQAAATSTTTTMAAPIASSSSVPLSTANATDAASGTASIAELFSCASAGCTNQEERPGQYAVCARCRNPRYCSRECQIRHWKQGHKAVCKTN